MRIGILGGTFDPIHAGHLYLAKDVLRKLSLDKIVFIPTYLSPHKKGFRITEARHRYNMVKLAIGDNKKYQISPVEIRRKGRSYSVETLRQLRKRYGPSVELFFITGSDSLSELDKWKNLRGILGLCKLVVVKRPGFAARDIPSNFITLDIDAKDISSTIIRNRIKEGKSVKKFLPEKVLRYIKKHRLY